MKGTGRGRAPAGARPFRRGGRRRAPLRASRGRSVLSGGRRRPRLGSPLLAVLALAVVVAAALALAALFRADSPGASRIEATSPIAPLRVASGDGIATGFAVADGRLVTVAHVLHGPVTVRGRRVRVLRVDRRADLALLTEPRVRAGAAPDSGAAALAPSAAALGFGSAADGQHLRVVRLRGGASSLLSVDVRRSIVAHVRVAGRRAAVARPALELSARVAPGDSGAPVIADDGALAGVLFAASRNRADTAYAVDASAVKKLLRRR
jgi:S1-C subfamily serine protease